MNTGESQERSPLVSICCQTYNHQPFIGKALQGFLMQETSFPFEIIVHDDASTDATAEVVREFHAKYPRLIRPILQTENQRSNGHKAASIMFPQTRGAYIAVCEGDDYWIEPGKLQRQVEFLEANPACALCFHNVLYEDSTGDFDGALSHADRTKVLPRDHDATFTITDTLRGGLIATCSVVLRNMPALRKLPSFFAHTLTGDWLLWLLACGDQTMRYLHEPMAVHRALKSGLGYAARRNPVGLYRDRARMLMALDRYWDFRLHNEIGPVLQEFIGRLPPDRETAKILAQYLLAQPGEAGICMLQKLRRSLKN